MIVVAGADWAAMVPYYSQRRALMIRNGLEYDRDYLKKAFDRLDGEDVAAVVIMNGVRTDRNFIDLVARRYDLDPNQPTFSWAIADVYIPRVYRKGVQLRIKSSLRYPQLTLPKTMEDELPAKGLIQISPAVGHNAFFTIEPAPYQAEFQFGLSWIEHGDNAVLSAHPEFGPVAASRRPVPPGSKWDYGIFAGAYEKPEKSTNGVEFIVDGERPDGSTRRVYYRILDPMRTPADRGDQHVEIPYAPLPDEVLRFSTRPNENSAFDWAYWIGIKVE